jgi:hypothetical protein
MEKRWYVPFIDEEAGPDMNYPRSQRKAKSWNPKSTSFNYAEL